MELRWYQKECIDVLNSYNYAENPICVLPTGTGKSVIIGAFIKNVLVNYNNVRVLMLTHVKELVEQNVNVMRRLWPQCPIGIYSAGLKRKDTFGNVIYGTVQSVIKPVKEGKLGKFDILVVDECHWISDGETTTYRTLIDCLREINPRLAVVGFTATPYRMKKGSLLGTGVFTKILYDLSEPEMFLKLVEQNYLSKLVPKKGCTLLNVEGIHVRGGDYDVKELSEKIQNDTSLFKIIEDVIESYYKYERKKCLIFVPSVEVCEQVKEMFEYAGEECETCHSKKKTKENDDVLERFKNGDLNFVVNNNKLTTGFDNPKIDLLVVLRPTKSKGLWVQMLGRGTRVHPDKNYCLVLDYTNNTRDLGPINQKFEHNTSKTANNASGEPVMKICDRCECYNYTSVRFCIYCGNEFFFNKTTYNNNASDLSLMEGLHTEEESEQVEVLKVDNVFYSNYKKRSSGKNILKVSYFSGLNRIDEYVCLEHEGFTRRKAEEWWNLRKIDGVVPNTVVESLKITHTLKKPLFLNVKKEGKYFKIIGVIF